MTSFDKPKDFIGRSFGISQRYRVEKILSEGGMGYVFLARDTHLGRRVALKFLKKNFLGDNEMYARFNREIELSAVLSNESEYIVKLFDHGITEEGCPFYVMEYLKGSSLAEVLREESRLSLKRSVRIARQICMGLQTIHTGIEFWQNNERAEIVHRDLKPDNIFLLNTGVDEIIRILDFGIAKKIGVGDRIGNSTISTQTFLGTYHYASPEQILGVKNVDFRTDIYSLGIILYEMLSGTNPFGLEQDSSPTPGTWASSHIYQLPKPIQTQPNCESLPPTVVAIVDRCLKKAPSERFSSAEELVQALDSVFLRSGIILPFTKPLLRDDRKEGNGTVIRVLKQEGDEHPDGKTIAQASKQVTELKRTTIKQERRVRQSPSLGFSKESGSGSSRNSVPSTNGDSEINMPYSNLEKEADPKKPRRPRTLTHLGTFLGLLISILAIFFLVTQSQTVTAHREGVTLEYPKSWEFREPSEDLRPNALTGTKDIFQAVVVSDENDSYKENILVKFEYIAEQQDLFLDDYANNQVLRIRQIGTYRIESDNKIEIDGRPAREIVYSGSDGEFDLKRRRVILADDSNSSDSSKSHFVLITYTADSDNGDYEKYLREVDAIFESIELETARNGTQVASSKYRLHWLAGKLAIGKRKLTNSLDRVWELL